MQGQLRALRILKQLLEGTCLHASLMSQHGADEKTINRDLAMIREAGFPLQSISVGDRRRAYTCTDHRDNK